jgi:catechol 2,3-dioxygenase-like lactoylglutathione lyase family enzyme
MTTLRGFHHVKVPVSDVESSRTWYERALGLETVIEFTEAGELMGVALQDPSTSVQIALRLDAERSAALAGFDPLALLVGSREDVAAWQARLDELGVVHGGIVEGHGGGSVLVGLHDPDGIEVRIYAD